MPPYLLGTRWLLPCRRAHPCRCGICVCRCAGTSSSSPQGRWPPPWRSGTAWWPSSFLLWLTSCSGRSATTASEYHKNIFYTQKKGSVLLSCLLWLPHLFLCHVEFFFCLFVLFHVWHCVFYPVSAIVDRVTTVVFAPIIQMKKQNKGSVLLNYNKQCDKIQWKWMELCLQWPWYWNLHF